MARAKPKMLILPQTAMVHMLPPLLLDSVTDQSALGSALYVVKWATLQDIAYPRKWIIPPQQ